MTVLQRQPSHDLGRRLGRLKRQRRAAILAHNYQLAEVQDAADVVGDSLAIARQARRVEAETIVLCGVHFMAETAKILNPERTVLVPDANAGCPLADMVTSQALAEAKRDWPEAAVVCYVNSSAAVKALSDICCTSSNAVRVVESIPAEQPILFVPDASLGDYVARRTGRGNLVPWPGYCPTHHRILPEHVAARREEYPGAQVCVHPECLPDVVAMADFVGSTSQIIRHVAESAAEAFIICTEGGICHRLRQANPGKTIVEVSRLATCPNMKRNTLEKVVWCLEERAPEVRVPEAVARRARRAIERMLEVG